MQNHKLNDFKFYEGITEENLKREKKELEKKGHEVTGFEIVELTNNFILFYNKKDVTKPPEEDLMKPTLQSVSTEEEPKNMIDKIMMYGKKYWVLSLGIGLALFYYYNG